LNNPANLKKNSRDVKKKIKLILYKSIIFLRLENPQYDLAAIIAVISICSVIPECWNNGTLE